MTSSATPRDGEVGPSTSTSTSRKPVGPHPSRSANQASTRKLLPPLPARPPSSSHPSGRKAKAGAGLPIKTIQGLPTVRTDNAKDGFGREVIFVTRSAPLGSLMGKCKSLVMDEGYTSLRLHALGAAIPHALLLLHALLDVLPYPVGERGLWYEIHTGSVECVDEVKADIKGKGKAKAKGKGRGQDGDGDGEGKGGEGSTAPEDDGLEPPFGDIGAMEEDEPSKQTRLTSSLQIDLHIGTKAKRKTDGAGPAPPVLKGNKRNRPSKRKRQRQTLKDAAGTPGAGEGVEPEMDRDEEEMMNIQSGGYGAGADEEVEEEVEM